MSTSNNPDVKFVLCCWGIRSYEIKRIIADPRCHDTDRFSDAKCVSSTTVAKLSKLEDAQAVLDLLSLYGG